MRRLSERFTLTLTSLAWLDLKGSQSSPSPTLVPFERGARLESERGKQTLPTPRHRGES